MKRTYPTVTQSQFLLCEIVRVEPNNKVTLIGWYPGNAVNIHPRTGQTKGPYTIPLGFAFLLRGGVGTFPAKFAIEGPKGTKAKRGDLGPQVMEADKAHLIALQLPALEFSESGKYTASIQLGQKTLRFPFSVAIRAQ